MSEIIGLEPIPGMRVWRYGSGSRAIVCLPGWSGHHRAFEPLTFGRPANTTLFVFDLPGFGGSQPPERWDLEAYARSILDAITALGIERYDLVGNCAGGVVAMEATKYTPGVRRLMLIDPFGFVPWYFSLLTVPWVGRFFYLSTFANPLGRIITNLVLRKKRSEETNLSEGFVRVDHGASHRFLAMLCRSTDLNRYADLNVPVDIVYGANTFEAVRSSVRAFERLWPGRTSTRELSDSGHLPIVEAPNQVAEVMYAPIGERRAARAGNGDG